MTSAKSGMCRHILVKLPNITFHENQFINSRVATCAQTDTGKAMGAFLQLIL
jgi:hypothetical protein